MSGNYTDGKFVYCRFRRKRNSSELMDAHDYGYQAWRIPIKAKAKQLLKQLVGGFRAPFMIEAGYLMK